MRNPINNAKMARYCTKRAGKTFASPWRGTRYLTTSAGPATATRRAPRPASSPPPSPGRNPVGVDEGTANAGATSGETRSYQFSRGRERVVVGGDSPARRRGQMAPVHGRELALLHERRGALRPPPALRGDARSRRRRRPRIRHRLGQGGERGDARRHDRQMGRPAGRRDPARRLGPARRPLARRVDDAATISRRWPRSSSCNPPNPCSSRRPSREPATARRAESIRARRRRRVRARRGAQILRTRRRDIGKELSLRLGRRARRNGRPTQSHRGEGLGYDCSGYVGACLQSRRLRRLEPDRALERVRLAARSQARPRQIHHRALLERTRLRLVRAGARRARTNAPTRTRWWRPARAARARLAAGRIRAIRLCHFGGD